MKTLPQNQKYFYSYVKELFRTKSNIIFLSIMIFLEILKQSQTNWGQKLVTLLDTDFLAYLSQSDIFPIIACSTKCSPLFIIECYWIQIKEKS